MQNSPPRPRGKEAVQTALTLAATKLIALSGVAAVSTRDIAAEAGVNQGLITRHFGTKQALIKQVANSLAQGLFAEGVEHASTLEALLLQDDPARREALRALIHIILAPLPEEGWIDHDLSKQFFAWLREKGGLRAESETALRARVFLIAAFVFGSELAAPSLRADLSLDALAFRDVKKDAVAILMKGMEESL